jgi:hypothetical protein
LLHERHSDFFVLDGKSEKGKFETSEDHGVFKSHHDAVAATFAWPGSRSFHNDHRVKGAMYIKTLTIQGFKSYRDQVSTIASDVLFCSDV